MLTKTNICSVQNYLKGNTDRQQFENDKQNVDLSPPGKIRWTPVNDCAFSLSFFSLLSCFHALQIVCFFPFSYFRFQYKQNQRGFCYYFIKITCNNKCYTQISTMGVEDYSKRQLITVRFSIWRALIETTSKWLRSLAAIIIQVKQHYCTMLATATGNCDVTNVTYNKNTSHEWFFESYMYLRRRPRQWLRHMVVMCHIAYWFRSGAVLKFDQFITQASSKPSLDFFPRKCTCVKVIGLRNRVRVASCI